MQYHSPAALFFSSSSSTNAYFLSFYQLHSRHVAMANTIRKETVTYVIVFVWSIFPCRIFDRPHSVPMSADSVDEGILKFMIVFALHLTFSLNTVVNDNWPTPHFDL